MTLIMVTMLSVSFMMILMKHPLSMGILLIIQTLLTSVMTGMLMNTFWMSYILLISMLSGMLVLFIYMSSIASNEKFINKMSMWMLMSLTTLSGLLFLFLEEKMIIKNNYLSMEMMNEMFILNKMFNMENMYLIMMLVSYLLLTMIVSTWLVSIFEGPMRLKI
uniref:NADH dehydrogenase subunit 6 n=2 Tax=Lygus TaxID=30084 RepID=A0A0F6MY43_9HEMI|nr:NADH dehydrogenase subunit 6 [Lygus pratensis]AHN95683.1 NADH dehydrogenase subunit 6 [Lygus rugulipennis]AWI69716.1 NADH dehydrogenase subunit 6 [Lygus pratensis]